jgi:hypothetical protein
VLHEVERLAHRQIVLVRGPAAAGDTTPSSAIADRPAGAPAPSDPRRLAAALVGVEAVSGVGIDGGEVVVSSARPRPRPCAAGLARRPASASSSAPARRLAESAFRELVR